MERLVSNTECEKVHKLSTRSLAGWLGSMAGVVAVGAGVFVALALAKGEERFQRELVGPVREYFRGPGH